MSEEITPIRQQYLQIKQQYPHAILFFRLGDFYETFDEDAQITSRELDLVLTSRNVAKGNRVPMAGIPYHAAENYLSRLIEKGYHVAICEQVGSQPAKGLFERQVVRVVTPGTLTEPGLLPGDRNNFLLAIHQHGNQIGLAHVDVSTGEFLATAFEDSPQFHYLQAELSRLQPAEVLISEANQSIKQDNYHFTRIPAWKFENGRCSERLNQQFNTSTLEGFGLSTHSSAVIAAGVILQYLQENQPQALDLLHRIVSYSIQNYMVLDASTIRNLELTQTIRTADSKGSLLGVLDHTLTPMGKRLIRQWVGMPLLDLQQIKQRHLQVEALLSNGLQRAEIMLRLKPIQDIERIISRIAMGSAMPRDLTALRSTITAVQQLKSSLTLEPESPLQVLADAISLHQEEWEILSSAIADEPPATLQNTGIIRAGYSEELDQIVESSKHARDWISNLEQVERERTGIRTLKVGYNKVFGYYIEISKSLAEQAPAHYIRKQTLVNGERFITPEMKEYESVVLNAEERIHETELAIFKAVCTKLNFFSNSLLQSSRAIASLDVLTSFAEVSSQRDYRKPEMTADDELEIHDGRHPVVETSLQTQRFIPNDVILESGEYIRIITGPNMSGKSTFLRQVALIVLMAQIGCFVPAKSARIGLVDRIFTRIGAQDEIHSGQSTFMVEMVETANILNHATRQSLLILDEIGRGTSTYDGVSIAWSVIEFLHNHPDLRCRTFFATHYHELTQLSEHLPGVRNYNVAVSESDGQVIFLHQIIPGGADRSYGIHVAQLAGLPKQVIQRANEILQKLETSSGQAHRHSSFASQQMTLFPETNPLLKQLNELEINQLSPIEALNILFEWRRQFRPPSDEQSK